MDILSLIIQLLSGAAGGNIVGSVMKNQSLGTVGNSIAGIIGSWWWLDRAPSTIPKPRWTMRKN